MKYIHKKTKTIVEKAALSYRIVGDYTFVIPNFIIEDSYEWELYLEEIIFKGEIYRLGQKVDIVTKNATYKNVIIQKIGKGYLEGTVLREDAISTSYMSMTLREDVILTKVLDWQSSDITKTVTRKSDGITFNVGDKFKTVENGNHHIITDFKVEEDKIFVGYYSRDKYYHPLNSITPEPKFSFTTHDGVEIKDPLAIVFYIFGDEVNSAYAKYVNSSYMYFSTEAAGYKYLKDNEKVYSKADIIEKINEAYALNSSKDSIITALGLND